MTFTTDKRGVVAAIVMSVKERDAVERAIARAAAKQDGTKA